MQNPESPTPGKKLGRGMWIATWLIGLLLLTLFFAEQESNWLNPNKAPQYQTKQTGAQQVTLERNRQGHYIFTGTINDNEADFLLDTGATDVVISGDLAKTYGLKRGLRGTASTANGNVTIYATRIEKLTIGNITLTNVPASINPSMDDLILLGMSALRQVELTQRGNTLTLKYYPKL
ncbi:MAG: retropepsin-like aspartic protease [Pseudomonadales bacterium]